MLNLYDTATQSVKPLALRQPGSVSIYLCGPTVYGPPHLGHGRATLVYDILRRYLTWTGLSVRLVSNITDIDDKIIDRANREGRPWSDITHKCESVWFEAMGKLGVIRPTDVPHATEYVQSMVDMINTLVSDDKAYVTDDGVYLSIASVPDYGLLAHQSLDDMLSGGGDREVFGASNKRHPSDFAMWKFSKPDEPSWPSPWGDGRPGWHIECSAMAHAYLGESFDIHGGGLDLIFPHHENEIAQSVSAGFGFANTWMHNAWVTTSGEKMSKSLGNSLQVVEILKKVRGIELRWYLGSAHYRSMLEFSFEALNESATAFKRIEAFLSRAEAILGKAPEVLIADEFAKAMNDDLAVPQALAFIAESMRVGNSAAEDKKVIAKTAGEIRGALSILGCDPKDDAFKSRDSNDSAIDGLIKLALEQREAARVRKDFAAADQIRDQIASLGITVEDTSNGPRWSY